MSQLELEGLTDKGRAELAKYLRGIRSEILKDQERMRDQEKKIKDLEGTLNTAIDGLRDIRKSVVSDQAKLQKKDVEIAKLSSVVDAATKGLRDIRREVLIESAARSDKAFRDEMVLRLKDIRTEFERMDKSHKKQLHFFGTAGATKGASAGAKEDGMIPASVPSKFPSTRRIEDEKEGDVAVSDDSDSPLTRTSLYTAAARSIESKRAGADRLFTDEYADKLAGDFGHKFIKAFAKDLKVKPDYLATFVALRTRYLDDKLVDIIKKQSELRQIVVIHAGTDTRAYRLDRLPKGRTFYYVDLPARLEYRQKMLGTPKIPQNVVNVPCDVGRKGWGDELLKQGYTSSKPGVFVLEGCIPYLNESECDNLMTEMSSLMCSGSCIIGDVPNKTNVQLKALHDIWNKYAESVKFGLNEPSKYFDKYGFETVEMEMLGVGQTNYHNRVSKDFLKQMKQAEPSARDPVARIYTFALVKK